MAPAANRPDPSRPHRPLVRLPLVLSLPLLLAATAPASAQTTDDGLLVQPRRVLASVELGRDRWDEYWEGALRRSNDNIGTLTTRTVTPMLGVGVTSRLSLFAALPHVQTEASAGVLSGFGGWQDVTVAAKYRLLQARVGGRATFGTLVTLAASAPTNDYTVDFLPLSIGFGSRRATGRITAHLQDRGGLFLDAAAGHTWRANVRLDRPAYYTDGHLYPTNEVAMPDVADFAVGVGFQRGPLCLPIALVRQRTLGGGDIRRQDMPFVSNRMDFTQLRANAMINLPVGAPVRLDLGAMRTLNGRNVGRSSAVTGGLTYAFGR